MPDSFFDIVADLDFALDGLEGTYNLGGDVLLLVNGSQHDSIPLPDPWFKLETVICGITGCGVCATFGSEQVGTCSACDGCQPGVFPRVVFPGVELMADDYVEVILVSVTGALPELPGFEDDDYWLTSDPGCVEGALGLIGSDPPDGAIDARQPFNPDGTDPQGWDSFVLEFDADASGVAIADFSLSSSSGTAPNVASAVAEDTKVTLTFDGTIPVGAWTTVTYECSGESVTIGYLPGDVSEDGTSSAFDVLLLIDKLNNDLIVMPDYSGDIDRSGAIAPADVLREVDLLNGAGAYDPYLGVTLP